MRGEKMTEKHRLGKITLKQLLTPAFCVLFLIFLGKYLLDQPLPEDLWSRKGLLVAALAVTVGLLVVGSLYSYICNARIQSYLCGVCLLVGIGFCYQFFFGDFSKFVVMTFAGLTIGIVVYLIYRRINVLNDTMFWLCAIAILALLAVNILFGQESNGARLWVDLKILKFQPGELVKVLLILLGASSFRNLVRSVIYCVVSLISLGVLLLLHDLGGAVVIFALFSLMVYLLFDNRVVSVGIIVAAVVALVIALRHLPYAAARFENWFGAMENPNSFQQRKFIIGALMGGLKGLGVEDHSLFTSIYAAKNDGALAGVMAVLGVPVILITLGAYALLAAQAALNRSVYTSSFFIHAQMGLYIVTHVVLNFAGATDSLPFTGVVAPVVSSGGSAILCFGILLGVGAAALNPQMKYYREQ